MIGDKIYHADLAAEPRPRFRRKDFQAAQGIQLSGRRLGHDDRRHEPVYDQGTHVMKVVDPETFKTARRYRSCARTARPLMQINELEW